jgi:hypothetical protein
MDLNDDTQAPSTRGFSLSTGLLVAVRRPLDGEVLP